MNITIREATVGDTRSVAELFDLYRQFYEQPTDLPRATAFIADRINGNESVILLTATAAGAESFMDRPRIATATSIGSILTATQTQTQNAQRVAKRFTSTVLEKVAAYILMS